MTPLGSYKKEIGDFTLQYPAGLMGASVNLGQKLLLRHPIFSMPCHAQRTIKPHLKKSDISAEITGVKMVNPQKGVNGRIEVWRDLSLTEDDKKKIVIEAEKYLGKKYDFYFYFSLWFIPISILFLPLYAWMFKASLLGISVYFGISTILSFIAKKLSIKTWACAELSTHITNEVTGKYKRFYSKSNKMPPFLLRFSFEHDKDMKLIYKN